MSDQFSINSIRLSITHTSPAHQNEPFAQTEDKILNINQTNEICIGRSPSNDICLNSSAVSGKHVRILRQGQEFFLEDLDSRNGTILNGDRLTSQDKKLLRSGDQIRIVPYDMRFFCGMEVYEKLPPTEDTGMIRDEMIRVMLGGVMGHEDTPPKLIVMSGVQANMQQFELVGMHPEFRIGRSPQCDLLIQDENISRDHAIVRRDTSGVYIRDLNSRNGVVINGNRLPRSVEQPLRDRDEILLGTIKILFSDPMAGKVGDAVGYLVEEPKEPQRPAISVPRPTSPPPNIADKSKSEANSSEQPEIPTPPPPKAPSNGNPPPVERNDAQDQNGQSDQGTQDPKLAEEIPIHGGFTLLPKVLIAMVFVTIILFLLLIFYK
jgi:pSer/pThr/pTyr-binding forkhead associated (FHA) protein